MTDGESVDTESLLMHRTTRADLPVHPRVWVALGGTYIALGLTLLGLAGAWRWWPGVALALGLAKIGTSLLGIGLTGGRQAPLPPGAGLGGRLQHAAGRAVLWGSAKMQRLFWVLRWPLYAYGLFVVLLIAVHLASPDPAATTFPTKCPHHKRLGCSRVAVTEPHAARGLDPLRLASPLNATQAAVAEWIGGQPGGRVLRSSPGFIHARFTTLVFGFADDLFVGLRCDGEGNSVVEAQGQLRIGKSDLGVNARRNQKLFAAVGAAAGGLPQGRCKATL